jgi:hypothetical protein
MTYGGGTRMSSDGETSKWYSHVNDSQVLVACRPFRVQVLQQS